jgi:hypothetical protein
MLDSLVLNDENTWHQEPNSFTQQNPNGSFFESVRHLFSNATNVPTTVMLRKQDNHLHVRTFWMGPIALDINTFGNFDWIQIPIQY